MYKYLNFLNHKNTKDIYLKLQYSACNKSKLMLLSFMLMLESSFIENFMSVAII